MLLFPTITEKYTRMVDEWTKTAGGCYQSLVVGILLRYLPTKQYIPLYLPLGFFLAAYFTSANAWYLNRQCDCCNYCI